MRQWHLPRETVPNYVLRLCVGGAADYRIGERAYRQKSGDLLLVPPNVPTAGSQDPTNPASVYLVHFVAHVYGVLDVAAVFGLPVHLRLAPRRMEQMVELVQQMVRELRARETGYLLAANAASTQLLMLICREAASQGMDGSEAALQPRRQRVRAADVERLAPVFLTIQARYAEQLTLAQLAAAVHLHPAYFSGLFKRVTGLPPRIYLRQYRLNRARELLVSTDLTVGRIAEQTGFPDQSYLSRVFRESEGCSPTRYRTRHTLNES